VCARVDVREVRAAGTTIREKGRNLFSDDDPEKTFCVYFGGDMVYKADAFW
jgi:hypothetical protein